MKLCVSRLPLEVSTEILKELATADGRKVEDVTVPERRGFGFVTTSNEDARAFIAALHGQTLCGKELRVEKARGRRRGRYGAGRGTSTAKVTMDTARKLRSPASGTKPWVSDVQGSKGIIQTKSKFQDPRRTVARSIEEALDPVRAPKTLKEYYAPDPLSDIENTGPGPETKAILVKLEADFGRKNALRDALKRAKPREKSSCRGITGEFPVDDAPGARSAAENTDKAIEFLRRWLSDGPRLGSDLLFDARRDEVPRVALLRALKELGGHRNHYGYWTLDPKPEKKEMTQADKPFQRLRYTKQQYALYDDTFRNMMFDCTKVAGWSEIEKRCDTRGVPSHYINKKSIMRKGSFFGKDCYFVLGVLKLPVVWVRNPDSTLTLLLHIQTKGSDACLVGTKAFHRDVLEESGVGHWDRRAKVWWVDSVETARYLQGKIVRAWKLMRRREKKKQEEKALEKKRERFGKLPPQRESSYAEDREHGAAHK